MAFGTQMRLLHFDCGQPARLDGPEPNADSLTQQAPGGGFGDAREARHEQCRQQKVQNSASHPAIVRRHGFRVTRSVGPRAHGTVGSTNRCRCRCPIREGQPRTTVRIEPKLSDSATGGCADRQKSPDLTCRQRQRRRKARCRLVDNASSSASVQRERAPVQMHWNVAD